MKTTTKMKPLGDHPAVELALARRTYLEALTWVALNDEPGGTTTRLIGDLFDVTYKQVARDVVTMRGILERGNK